MNLTSRCPQRSRMSEGEDAGIKTAIQKAMCDKNVTPFSTYLQSVTCGSQLIKLSVIQELRFFLQEKCHASEYVVRTECVLLFLEYMKTVSCESENWDAVTRDLITMSTLCFLNGLLVYKKDENKEDLVVKIVHALSDLMSVSPKVSVGIAQVLSSVLLRVFVQENLSFMIRKNFLSTLAHMITMCTMQIRHVVLCKHMPELRNLSDFMITCGDYELQSTILEIILQLLLAAGNENEFSKSLFPSYPAISDAFVSHSFENLRSELRQFLNKVNTLSERKLVYSVPCVAAFSNNKELRKPDECNEFWVDVCISSKCLYINHQEDTARPCNLTHISEKDVKQIISAECNYVVNSKGVQCTRLDVYDNNYDLLKIYFPKTELFICLQKDVLTRLFGKKYRDVGAVATDNTPFTKMNNTVQNDSPDEIDSPPQQIQSNKKDKSKFVRSIRKNCNENNRPTSTAAFDNNNKKSRILENKNTNLQSEPDVGLIRRRKSYSSEDNSCINESNNVNNKSGNNNNNGGNEETKKVDRSNDLLNIMPAITKKRGYNKVVNGKLCPLKASLHSKDTELSKAQNCGRTPRNSLEKRKLYSFQNEDYIFSSVEEYTASLPNFYKNKEKKNDVNSKVTYSYRANKSVENKIQQEDMIFSDMLESRYKTLSLTNTPKHFPVKINVPKNNKLKKQMPIELDNDSSDEKRFFKSNKFASAVAAWNRTPIKKSKKSENTKSVYSDLSSSETDTIHVIAPFNTYSRKPISRQKITKSPKRKIVHIDSDSDSDSNYKPLSSYLNIKSVERCTRQRHKQSSVVELVNREHEYDRLRECNEAECSEELPLCGYMNLSNETVTAKDIQVAPMPLLPEISPTNAVYNIENDETILLKFSPSQKVKNNFVKQKNCVKKNSNVSHDGPTRRKKYIQVKSKKISRNKNAKISEESTAVASSHKVTARNSQRDARVDNVEVKSGKNSCGKNQNKNVSPKKKSSVIDQNTLFDDLTVYCDHNQLTESNMCSQDNADVHETSINNEIDNSQSSLRSSCRIKDLTHKDDLCRFGTALTKHMKMKLTGIQDELKEERNVQYSELDTVLVGELENIEKQKQKILSVAKEMETCRKVLEGAFSVQMKTCEELEKSIGNISSRKDNFLKEAKKTDMKQSSQIMESMNVFKEKMRGFVNTFIAADKKLINK